MPSRHGQISGSHHLPGWNSCGLLFPQRRLFSLQHAACCYLKLILTPLGEVNPFGHGGLRHAKGFGELRLRSEIPYCFVFRHDG